MATPILTGTAVLYGITPSGSSVTLGAYSTCLAESIKAAHKAELTFIKDATGHDAAAVSTNGHTEIDVTMTIAGASKSAAAGLAAFPTSLAKVTLAGYTATFLNGDWLNIDENSIDLSQGAAKINLKLRKYDDNTQNGSMTTAVSS